MTGGDPLAQLRDIHLPEPVGWWPPAPGWWLAGILFLLVAVTGGRYLLRRLRNGRYRREAGRELRRLAENRVGGDDRQFVEELAILLRRVAIHAYGREAVARLSGRSWLAFLDRKGDTDQFTNGPGRVLGEGLYRAEIEAERDRLITLVEKWLGRRHPC
ncbi:MAG: DUF4381 domain-containing protein [Desulfurivibrionaceae bacterium]|nr:DUF4381 domain-containing protein [Desulfobulbales bacterium]MDT8334694.1 DUF4381 domain-containing protein [Desulfurivibrionaceae bacterium]